MPRYSPPRERRRSRSRDRGGKQRRQSRSRSRSPRRRRSPAVVAGRRGRARSRSRDRHGEANRSRSPPTQATPAQALGDARTKLFGSTQPVFAQPEPRPMREEDFAGKTDEEISMMQLMGFSGFGTTKGKKVENNDVYAAHVVKKRKYRQYMNRRGGFNRPLDPVT